MSARERARHVEPITVRWGDVDSMGHVNNAKYFTYCESARMTYFAAVGMNDHRETERHGPALAAANLNFRRQVRWPAELEVATRVSEIGRSSFKMEYEIFHRGTGRAGRRRLRRHRLGGLRDRQVVAAAGGAQGGDPGV